MTIWRTRVRFTEGDTDRTLHGQSRPAVVRVLDESGEATLVILACSDNSHGEERWTLAMLADELVELGVVETISADTVERVLKQTHSNRGGSTTGASR